MIRDSLEPVNVPHKLAGLDTHTDSNTSDEEQSPLHCRNDQGLVQVSRESPLASALVFE